MKQRYYRTTSVTCFHYSIKHTYCIIQTKVKLFSNKMTIWTDISMMEYNFFLTRELKLTQLQLREICATD